MELVNPWYKILPL